MWHECKGDAYRVLLVKCEGRSRLARSRYTQEANFQIIFKWDEKDWIGLKWLSIETSGVLKVHNTVVTYFGGTHTNWHNAYYTGKHSFCHMKTNLCLCLFFMLNSNVLLELLYHTQFLYDRIFKMAR